MNSVTDALANFAGSARPLKTLSKEELFVFPKASPDSKSGFKFLKEVIFRRYTYEQAQNRIQKINQEISLAHVYQNGAANKDQKDYAKRRLEALNKDLAQAVAAKEKLADDPNALSHEEVVGFYRADHLQDFNETLARYRAGQLFKCQSAGWASFLVTSMDEIEEDAKAYRLAENYAMLCEEDHSQIFWEIKEIYRLRIRPPRGWRKRFLDEDGDLATISGLGKERQKEYWAAWFIYNTATKKYNWADDSGLAYDERAFINYENQTKEGD